MLIVMNFVKTWIKQALRACNIHVSLTWTRGVEVFDDFRYALPNQCFSIIFDIGANIGQSTASYLSEFPNARIWSFEPSKELHSILTSKFSSDPRVTCERLALGSANEDVILNQTSNLTMFHLSDPTREMPDQVTLTGTESVHVVTTDAYCKRNQVDCIDFLKIDTEGHDLEVLQGARDMLAAGRIGCVQCECGLTPGNHFHQPLDKIKSFLESFGYGLFGVYDQSEDGFSDSPSLRRANVVFVSPAVMQANKISLR